jgi:ribose transport system ATP-binding protein
MHLLLEMRGITKRYPGVLALNDVSFSLQAGEVHALVGENGAGKSTLMKILSGAIDKDSGDILIDGIAVRISSPLVAQQLGVSMMYQDFKLIPELTVSENVFLGREPTRQFFPFIDSDRMSDATRRVLSQLGEKIDPEVAVKYLSIAHRQVVEISKALLRESRILVMDEPTAPLTEKETQSLFRVIRALKSKGVGIIYISHRLDEIFDIADRITVLRDGSVAASCSVRETDRSQLINWMVGRPMEEEYPRVSRQRGREILRVENLSTRRLRDINLTAFEGEILGIGGLVGAGRTELAQAIFGVDPILRGKLFLENMEFRPRSPHEAIERGIGLLTEDRNLRGLILQMSVRENISLSSLDRLVHGAFIDHVREQNLVEAMVDSLRIKTPSLEKAVETLSGGNRQKVVLARWLSTKSKLLVFDEPTAGIDVGTKFEIYTLMNHLALQGMAIIVISSDISELIGMSDRIAVMCDGRITGILGRAEATQEAILKLATKFDERRVQQGP